MMIRKMTILAIVLMLCGTGISSASAEKVQLGKRIAVIINGERVVFPDQQPKLVDQSVLVPVRFVSDKLGGKLSLKGKDITIVKGDRTVKLTIGASTATVNGKQVALGAPANAEKGRTYVPLRFVSDALGEKVQWDQINKFVWIGEKKLLSTEDDRFPTLKLADYQGYWGEDWDIVAQYPDLPGAKMFTIDSLPFIAPNRIGATDRDATVYDIWFAVEDGEEVIKMTYTGPRMGMILLTDGKARGRSGTNGVHVPNPDGTQTLTVKLKMSSDYNGGILDWDSFKYSDIRYIQIMFDAKHIVLLENTLVQR